MSNYSAKDFSVTLPAADYVRRFRDAERIAGYCRACPNFGHSWNCPPFEFEVDEYLSGYRSALLVATKITPTESGMPIAAARQLTLPERRRLEECLLDLERRYGGRSFAYAGKCLHCQDEPCSRLEGKPCRHPELVRPSLEACGFDIEKTTTELFEIDLKWGMHGEMPEYLTLVCGFFHNADDVVWG